MLSRRYILKAAALLATIRGAASSRASPAEDAAVGTLTKGAQVLRGRVTLAMPAIAENGFSVFTTVEVDSPMSESDYVRAVHLFSEKNPVPRIASFYFTPALAAAKVSTNIRLSASQKITAIAVMSDGSLWSGERSIVVTIAACIDGG